MVDRHDSMTELSDLGVSVLWIEDMRYGALYVEQAQIMILNCQCSRDELGEAVSDLMPLVFQSTSELPPADVG